jgi:hypothetical protein
VSCLVVVVCVVGVPRREKHGESKRLKNILRESGGHDEFGIVESVGSTNISG